MEEHQTVETVARRLGLLVLLAVAFGASAMLTIYLLFRSGEVVVPNTVGMSQEEAQRAIARAGLGVRLRRQHFDAEIPPGTVSEQDPIAGFPVKEGYEVKLDISKGPDPSGKDEEPPPPGPTNPVDGPKVDEAAEAAEKRKKKREEKKLEEAKAAEAAKAAAAAADEPGAAKATDPAKPKPKPAGEAPKSGDTAKPKSDAAKPDAPKPKPAPVKPPPSR